MTATASIVSRVGRKRIEPDTSTYSGRLAARVRELREKEGWTVPEMAEAVGIATTTLYEYESNRRAFPVDIVVKIAEQLGKNPGIFFPR